MAILPPASSVNFSEKSNQNNFHKISPLYYVRIPVPTNVAYCPTQCPRCAILIASQGPLCLSRIISLPSQTFPSTKAIISCTVKQNTLYHTSLFWKTGRTVIAASIWNSPSYQLSPHWTIFSPSSVYQRNLTVAPSNYSSLGWGQYSSLNGTPLPTLPHWLLPLLRAHLLKSKHTYASMFSPFPST